MICQCENRDCDECGGLCGNEADVVLTSLSLNSGKSWSVCAGCAAWAWNDAPDGYKTPENEPYVQPAELAMSLDHLADEEPDELPDSLAMVRDSGLFGDY